MSLRRPQILGEKKNGYNLLRRKNNSRLGFTFTEDGDRRFIYIFERFRGQGIKKLL